MHVKGSVNPCKYASKARGNWELYNTICDVVPRPSRSNLAFRTQRTSDLLCIRSGGQWLRRAPIGGEREGDDGVLQGNVEAVRGAKAHPQEVSACFYDRADTNNILFTCKTPWNLSSKSPAYTSVVAPRRSQDSLLLLLVRLVLLSWEADFFLDRDILYFEVPSGERH